MKQKIAVESNLTPIKEYLSNKGYEVESVGLNAREAITSDKEYDAYVVTGLNTNFLGINDTETKAVVINASGLTAEEVYKELQSRME